MRNQLFITLGLTLLLTAPVLAQDWSWAGKDGDGFLTVNPAKVRGDVLTSGSSTVFPLAQYIVDQFKGEGYTGQLSIDNIGTGAGLRRFGAGEIDFANASRPIIAPERKAAEARGKGKVLEFAVAMDALVIIVNKKNTFLNNLSEDQVRAVFGTAETWSDVDPSWPNEAIRRQIPETSHGTFDFFQEHFWDDKGALLKAASSTQRFQDYNQLISVVEREKNAVGFIGFSYYRESDNTRQVAYEGVTASKATVENRTYGLSRYLYVYANQGTLRSKPQSAGYLAYFLNTAARAAPRLGFFALTPADLTAQKKQLAAAVSGLF